MATKIFLKTILQQADSHNRIFRRNLLKEYLQILVLDFIYSHPHYSQLIFYGGSCLAHCFGLPRLSEDLDFVDLKKKIKIKELSASIELYFKKNTDLPVKAVVQKFRVYLKFPILRELALATRSESDWLFLKIEIFSGFDFCRSYKIEVKPLFKFNQSMLVRIFDLPTLMSTKIRAVLYRQWLKTTKNGQTIIKAKGRDYFDLMWYLEKGVRPNLSCLGEIKSLDELKARLLAIIDKLDAKSVQLDLEALISDKRFVENTSKNIKAILRRGVESLRET